MASLPPWIDAAWRARSRSTSCAATAAQTWAVRSGRPGTSTGSCSTLVLSASGPHQLVLFDRRWPSIYVRVVGRPRKIHVAPRDVAATTPSRRPRDASRRRHDVPPGARTGAGARTRPKNPKSSNNSSSMALRADGGATTASVTKHLESRGSVPILPKHRAKTSRCAPTCVRMPRSSGLEISSCAWFLMPAPRVFVPRALPGTRLHGISTSRPRRRRDSRARNLQVGDAAEIPRAPGRDRGVAADPTSRAPRRRGPDVSSAARASRCRSRPRPALAAAAWAGPCSWARRSACGQNFAGTCGNPPATRCAPRNSVAAPRRAGCRRRRGPRVSRTNRRRAPPRVDATCRPRPRARAVGEA